MCGSLNVCVATFILTRRTMLNSHLYYQVIIQFVLKVKNIYKVITSDKKHNQGSLVVNV